MGTPGNNRNLFKNQASTLQQKHIIQTAHFDRINYAKYFLILYHNLPAKLLGEFRSGQQIVAGLCHRRLQLRPQAQRPLRPSPLPD